jgi:hypothetical protein
MNLILILVILTGALASVVRFSNAGLAARLIDPATMDPTRFSVLSVLKTAIPTSPNTPMPTGNYEPEWYEKLPNDVKSLLQVLYPVAALATPDMNVSQTPVVVESSVAAVQTETKMYTDATKASFSPTGLAFESSCASASAQSTHTETLQYTPATTASAVTPYSGLVPNNTVPATGTGTLATTSATTTNLLSVGARVAVKTETLAVIAWIGVGAGFFLFA